MQRRSDGETDAVVWQTVGIQLGTEGMDLRNPAEPNVFSDLHNARFPDERSIERRNGHAGGLVQDRSDFPALGDLTPGDWVYGHGNLIGSTNEHYPISRNARATFNLNGTDVVWTGDRLIIPRDSGAGLGHSTYWRRGENGDDSGTVYQRGIPAFLPLITELTPSLGGDVTTSDAGTVSIFPDYISTCLTETLRVIAWNTDEDTLVIGVLDRAKNDAVIDTTTLEVTGVVNIEVVNSGGTPVCLYIDGTGDLNRVYWTGLAWSDPFTVESEVDAFDVAMTPDGFHLLWSIGGDLHVGRFVGIVEQDSPYPFDSDLGIGTPVTAGIALAVAPDESLGVLWQTASNVKVAAYTNALAYVGGSSNEKEVIADDFSAGGLAICSRGIPESDGHYTWVIHAGDGKSDSDDRLGTVKILSYTPGAGGTVYLTGARYNSELGSRSFRVGDEVFVWYRSCCASTHYLGCGVVDVFVAGYADREEAIQRKKIETGNYAIPHVNPDPADEDGYTHTWARPYFSGYRHATSRVGDIDFMPRLSVAQYGHSLYLSGSAVKNWDGVVLSEAGFHDYPIITANSTDTSGSMGEGLYQYRAYLVDYNNAGERFMSAALTYSMNSPAGDNVSVALTIKSVPSVTSSTAVIEVYRTKANGSTFYYEGRVANTFSSETVSFTSGIADTTLDDNPADPHETGVSTTNEIEEFGPIGCAVLATGRDRLWGIGGQVPSGTAQFSKLKESGEGAGFDAIDGFTTVDSEGGGFTSVFEFNDAIVLTEAKKVYVLGGNGPDNFGQGSFAVPQLALAAGATTHFGTALTQAGAVFWGEQGPMLLSQGFQISTISAPVQPLSRTLTPTGVQVDLSRMEVVWYTEDGTALLWNYMGGKGRWARWTGLEVAGCSEAALVTPDGKLLVEDADAWGDDARGYAFGGRCSNIRPEQLLGGATAMRRVGISGDYLGPHDLRFRIYYNGSPSPSEEFVWSPSEDTWLNTGEDWADLTPAEIDALGARDHSGTYAMTRRLERQSCRVCSVSFSDVNAGAPTYTPIELSFELGAKPGLGKTPVQTINERT